MKVCKDCRIEKPFSEFHKKKRRPYYQERCKNCNQATLERRKKLQKEYDRKYYENNFEKMVDGNRISRILNQISMIFTPLGGDGGLFVFIGKKLM